jgi:hypothetical protein
MLAEAKAATLTDLATQINEAHEQCVEAYKSSLYFARTAGALLIEAKSQLQHGQWLPWLRENTSVAERTAQAYMQVSRDWAVLEESAAIADLSFRDALKLLSQGEEATEPLMLEAELVEEPTPPKPGKVEYLAGSKAKVVNPKNLYHGQEVTIVERQADFCIGRTPQGKEYPFFSRELEPAEPVVEQVQVEQRVPQPSRLERLVALVRRILEAVELPEELQGEAQSLVGGDRS